MKRKPTNIPNNDTLCAQDMSRATQEQQIIHLTQIMENELRRGDDADETLLLECAEHLEQLSPESVPAAATVEARLQAVTAHRAARQPHRPTRRSVRTALLRVGAVAAVFALVFAMAPQVYAHALMVSEHNATKELIEQAEHDFLSAEVMTLSQKAHGELPFTTIEPDEFIPEPNYFVKYGSVSDFWNSERLNVLFPKDLTDVIGSIEVAVRNTAETSRLHDWTVRCAPTDYSWIYNVSYYQEGKQSSMTWYEKNCEPYTVGDTIFYIEELPKSVSEEKPWQATCIEGNVRYSILTEDRATLEMLLQNIVRTSTLPIRESTFTSLEDYEREPGYKAEYHSFEELMAGEDILMIYPKDIPASFGNHTLDVRHTVHEEQGRCWTITCRPDETETDAPIWAYNTFYRENADYPSAIWYEEQYESYIVGDHIFYIQQFEETRIGGYNWQASCVEGQVRFVILTADYETLKTLMDLTVRAE